jgi:iron complex outermembrane receptor protein
LNPIQQRSPTRGPDGKPGGAKSARPWQVSLLALLSGMTVGAASQVRAADENTNAATAVTPALEEVVVTARKRTESLQKTPVAISVVTEKQLQIQHADTITDIAAQLPNIQIFRQAAVGDVASTYLRGFGAATNDPSVDLPVATYINGIYIPQAYGTLVDTFDLASIEIDRGPQDTLLGKNSPVGAVVITTKKPTGQFGAEIQADYGSFDYYGILGRVEIPILPDVLAANISFLDENGGNFTHNLFTHKNDMGGVNKQVVRASIDYTPNDRFKWWVTGSGSFDHDPQTADRDGSTAMAYPPFAPTVPLSCAIFGHCTPGPYGTTNSEDTKHNESDFEFFSSQMSYRFDPVTVNFDTGAMFFSGRASNDIDGEPQDIIEVDNGKNLWSSESGELRVSSNKNGGWDLGGKLDWLIGVYAFNEVFRQDSNLTAFGSPVDTGQRGDDTSEAIFGHFVYHLTDALNFTFGVRETWDQKSHSYYDVGTPVFTDHPASWTNTSLEAGVQYQISPDKMVYFRFAQGYRGGGFIGVPAVVGQPDTFNPETNNTYEVGAKTQWLDDHLRLNIDMFRGDYSNLQEDVYIRDAAVATDLISITKNVASATVQGVEVEGQALPFKNLTIGVSMGWLDAAYNSYFADVVGNGQPMQLAGLQRFGFAPQFTGDINASYTVDLHRLGKFVLRGDYNVRTHQYLDSVTSPQTFQPGYGLLNASLEWDDPSGRYSLTFYGKNVLNQHYETDTAPISLVTVLVDGAPAIWGMTLRARF